MHRRALLLVACLMGLALPSSALASAWDKPALASPVSIALSDSARNLQLDPSTDYILTCANPVSTTWGLVVSGGHNVVLQGCDYNQGAAFSYAAQFKNQTGTLWLSDVHFQGTDLSEGIDFQEPSPATVVLRDVLIDTVHGSYQTNHADCVQTWSGPARFLIDGFTCHSQYQGLLLLPNQWDTTTVETVWDFRHVDLTVDGGYSNWIGWVGRSGRDSVAFGVQDFYVSGAGEPRLYPNWGQWTDVLSGVAPVPGGHYVMAESWGASGPDEPGGTPGSQGAGESPLAYIGEQ
ncbi:MAG: hypothetical protein ACXVHB_05885 [Solirubrobacteraceae bacterium]